LKLTHVLAASLVTVMLVLLSVAVHELNLILLPRELSRSPRPAPQPHPFLPQPSLPRVSFEEQAWSDDQLMHHWWSVLWMLPLSLVTAVGLLQVVSLVRNRPALRALIRACHPSKRIGVSLFKTFSAAWHLSKDIGWITIEFVRYLIDLFEISSALAWPWQTISNMWRATSEFIRNQLHRVYTVKNSVKDSISSGFRWIYDSLIDRLRSLYFDHLLPVYERAESEFDYFCCQHVFPIVDRVLEYVPPQVRYRCAQLESFIGRQMTRVRESRAMQMMGDVCHAVTSSFGPFSPSPPTTFHYALSTTPSSSSRRRRVEVGRGSPFQREDARELEEHEGMQLFHDLLHEEVPPSPSSIASSTTATSRASASPFSTQLPFPTARASPFNSSVSEPAVRSHDVVFESKAWREFEDGQRAVRHARRQQQAEEDKKLKEEARYQQTGERGADQPPVDQPIAVVEPSTVAPELQMPVWKEEEMKHDQRDIISPVAYVLSSRSDGWQRQHRNSRTDS
jgi:hypothetical protein